MWMASRVWAQRRQRPLTLEKLDRFDVGRVIGGLAGVDQRLFPAGDRFTLQTPGVFLGIGAGEVDLGQDRVFHRPGARQGRGAQGGPECGGKDVM